MRLTTGILIEKMNFYFDQGRREQLLATAVRYYG